MSMKLKVGIAGYGIVGKRRRQYIDCHPNLETVAVSDQKFKGQGQFDDGVLFYDCYENLLKNTKLDILLVCLPNYLAPIATIKGLENNLHVFCEKPPGRTVQDVRDVIEVETRFPHLKLMYGFNHRYHHSVKEALRIVTSGEMGRLINLRGVYGKSVMVNFKSDWRTERDIAGGGILLDQGIHMVDLLRLFAGEFKEVMSIISNDFWKYDVEDNAYALMKTESGVVAMLNSSATQWRHRFQLDIALENGMVVLAGILSGTRSYGAETITVAYRGKDDSGDPREVTTRYNEDNSWNEEIESFANSVLTDKKVVYGSSQDALKTMELVFDIYLADKAWSSKYQITKA